MFSPATIQPPTKRITHEPLRDPIGVRRRSLRELVRDAVDTAIEFATLGEATLSRPAMPAVPPAPHREHPHRRPDRRPRARRAGTLPARTQVCTTPTRSSSAERH